MQLTPIEVQAYSGHKADESPRRLCWDGQWIEVEQVLDRWYQAAWDPEWPLANYFKVHGSDGHQYLLKHDLEDDTWFVGQRW